MSEESEVSDKDTQEQTEREDFLIFLSCENASKRKGLLTYLNNTL
jgi:hypothetical protein